ncbi:hypothetical protein UlMin_004321 [Ulmus minor]
MAKSEIVLRISSVLLLVLTACLVGFDTQTKAVFYITKKATYKDLKVLTVLVYVFLVAAGYNLLRLCNSSYPAWFKSKFKGSNVYYAWISFLLDQIVVYVTFATHSAAFEGALIAVKGVEDFQWMKVCDKFKKFCFQIGGALLCGYFACLIMIVISSISAFHLFRLYSPKRFFLLEGK